MLFAPTKTTSSLVWLVASSSEISTVVDACICWGGVDKAPAIVEKVLVAEVCTTAKGCISAAVFPSPPAKIDLPAFNLILFPSNCTTLSLSFTISSSNALFCLTTSCSPNSSTLLVKLLFSLIRPTTFPLNASPSFSVSCALFSPSSSFAFSFRTFSISARIAWIFSWYCTIVASYCALAARSLRTSSLSCLIWKWRRGEW